MPHVHANAHTHSVTGMTGVHGTGMGTPMHHHQYRPVPNRDFDDCDSEKQTHSLTSSDKESKKTEKEPAGCNNGRGGTCNWLTFILAVALILSLSAVIALVTEALIHGCFRAGGGEEGGGGGGGLMRAANAPGDGGDIGTDMNKMLIERKIDQESAKREMKTYMATDGSKCPYQKLRLPRHFLPGHYDLRIHPNLTTFNFSGHVHIRGVMAKKSNFLIFHAKKNLKNLKVTVFSLSKARAVTIITTKYCQDLDQVYVLVDRDLSSGESVRISIEFSGVLEAGLQGFYRSSYTSPDGKRHWIATTHFEPTYARWAFPCFDEPDFKANFSVTLIRERNHVALSNMPSAKVRGTDGVVSETFKESVRMSTYLVAFIVCDFQSITNYTNNGVRVSVWAPKAQIGQTPFALRVASQVLDYYSEFFRTEYPLPKLDLIAVPDFPAGAMENWGLITYRMSSLLYDPARSSRKSRQWVAEVVAHELAHQWFGNLVTMKWWSDLWLNEGFANFVDRKGVERIFPKWKFMDQQLATHTLPAMHEDSYVETHPIQVVVRDPKEIAEIFDRISYDKGSAVLQMLSAYIGASTMSNGLGDYLQKYKYGNAETHDLWASLEEASEGIPIGSIMDTWTKQSGYPLLTVKKEGNKMTISQQRYLINPKGAVPKSELSGTGKYLWKIPIHYVTSDNTSQVRKQLMEGESISLPLGSNPAWVKLNWGQVGFYRVDYDKEGWKRISDILLTNHLRLPSADRAGVIDDAFSLARSGQLSIDVALDISKYLHFETEYIPWKTGLGGLGYLMHLFEERKEWPLFKNYLKSQMYHLKEKFGIKNLIDEDRDVIKTLPNNLPLLDIYLRNTILRLLAFLGDKDVVKYCQGLFKYEMRTGKFLGGGGLRAVVYTTVIQYGGEEEFEFIWGRYQTSQVASEKKLMLMSLTKTSRPELIRRLLFDCLDEKKIKSQDAWGVIKSLAATTAGKCATFSFVRKNWDTLVGKYPIGSNSLGRLLKGVTSRYITDEEYQVAREWYGSLDPEIQKMRAVRFSLERIRDSASWLNQNGQVVAKWLRINVMSYNYKKTTRGYA